MNFTVLDIDHRDDGTALVQVVTDQGRRLAVHLPAGQAHSPTVAEDLRAAVELALTLRVRPS